MLVCLSNYLESHIVCSNKVINITALQDLCHYMYSSYTFGTHCHLRCCSPLGCFNEAAAAVAYSAKPLQQIAAGQQDPWALSGCGHDRPMWRWGRRLGQQSQL